MTQPTRLCYAGIDWAAKLHVVCVVDAAGAVRARFQVPNTGKGFAGLCRRLAKLGVAAVAIERPDGPLVEALIDHGLQVVVVTPRQVRPCAAAIALGSQVRPRRRLPAGRCAAHRRPPPGPADP